MPTLYGVNGSPFVRKVRVVLGAKGIDYKLEPIMPLNVSEEYKKKSPLGKIPCWEEDGLVLPDSSCICAYLERIHPEPAVYPPDPKQYARALWYEEYADSKLADTIGPIFFERFVKARILKAEPDEARVRKQIDEALPPVLDYLEGEVGDGDAIVGNRFSIADIAIGSVLLNLRYGRVTVDASRWPKLARYVEAVHANPAVEPIIEEEAAEFGL